MKLRDKKGFTIGDLQGIVLLLIIIGILFGASLYVLAELNTQLTNADLYNESTDAVQNVTGGLGDLASWLPVIVVVIAAAIVIGIVFRWFSGMGGVR